MSEQVREAFSEVVKVGVPGSVDATVFAQNSFFFQQRRGKLDMRSLARVDIERVIEECDVGTLQVHLENLTFADLTTDDMTSYTDEHFLKLFRMSQLTIEYLLNVQNALLTYSRSVEEETEKLKAAADEGERRLKSRHSKVNSLKRSLKQQRQTLKTYESLLKQHQQQAPPAPPASSQAPSPGGGNIMTASDGTTYISVDYLKSKAGRAASMRNERANAADSETQRRMVREAEDRRQQEVAREKQWEIKFGELQRKIDEKEKKSQNNDEFQKNLDAERKARETVEERLERARADHERNVDDVRREVQEQMRSMKAMMEAELREQRALAEQARLDASSLSGSNPATTTTNAGDMESDSDDELHDHESMGSMRRSKRELAKMVSEQQVELERLRNERESMRQDMIEKYISAKEKGREKTLKTIVVDGWRAYLQGLEHERQTLTLRMANDESTRATQVVTPPSPSPSEEEPIVPTPIARADRNGKMFTPTYKWKKCPPTSKLPHIEQLELEEKSNDDERWEEVRIPPMWDLALSFAVQGTSEILELDVSVHRALKINDLLLNCAKKLSTENGIQVRTEEGPGSLCLLSASGSSSSSGSGSGGHNSQHILSRDDDSTVESNHLFLKRPRLVLFSGMTDAAVNEIVNRFVKHVDHRLSKNKNRLKKNVRQNMEIQDEAVVAELTEAGKLTDEHVASLVPIAKTHESTQFASVTSIHLHDEQDIDEEQNEILAMIKDELSGLGLKKTRNKKGGKKKIRGLTESDFQLLMEDQEWHLTGQG
jgi:hypothetical protein